MQTVIVGVGYTGQRVLAALPADRSQGLSRKIIDLDEDSPKPVSLPESYALLYTVPPGKTSASDERLETLLGMLQTPPNRFVYLSTSGVYGDCGGRSVDETARPNPMSERAKRRLWSEHRLTDWSAEQGSELTILRVPAIYGPGRLGIDRIKAGTPVIAEAEAGPGNRIHVDDLVACCLTALEAESSPGIYNVGDGDHRSGTWFAKTVAEFAGLAAPPEVSRDEAEATFSDSRLSFLRESRTVDTTRMRDVLGVSPRYANCEDGIRESLS